MDYLPLPDVAKIIMGQSPPSSTYNKTGNGLPFYQGKAEFGDLYPEGSVYCNKPNKLAEPGDILISVRAPVGPTNITSKEACIGRGLAAIRCHEDKVIRMFLLYYLRSIEHKIASDGKGSTFDAIGKKDLEAILIPKLPIQEQMRIAAILEKADRLRHLRHYARKLSDTFLQSVFLDMFGDPILNPKDWKVVRIGDVISSSQYGTSQRSNNEMIGYPIIGMGNVTENGKLELCSLSYVDLSPAEFDKLKLEKGDVIFNRTNSTKLVGKTALWSIDIDAVIASYLVKIRLTDDILPTYFVGLVNMPSYKQLFQLRCRKAVGQSNISPTLLKEFNIPLPPLVEQKTFQRAASRFEDMQRYYREAESQGEHLFQSLLHRAFRGEM